MRPIEKYAVLEALCELRDNAIKWVIDCKAQQSAMTPRAEQAVLTFNECISQVKKASAVDAVEVVRCKDCRWWDTNGYGAEYDSEGYGWCEKIGEFDTKKDWYCADGERKGEDDDTD